MSTIRPLINTSNDVQSRFLVQKQIEMGSLHQAQLHHDLEAQAAARSTDHHQETVDKSDHRRTNNDDALKDSHSLSSHTHHDHQDKIMQFYTNKENVKSCVGSKHLVDNEDGSKEDGDEFLNNDDDSDNNSDSSKPTLQSLASHAGRVIGQTIGMGVGGFFLGSNNGGSTTTSSESSGKDKPASLQATSSITDLIPQGMLSEVDHIPQEMPSEMDAVSQPYENSKNSLSGLGENTSLGTAFAANNPIAPMISSAGENGSLASSSMLQEGIPKPIAAAVRSAQFSDSLMKELTASVQTLRLNKPNGQDMTLNLRSDVLEATSIHIMGNATHIAVDFLTANAMSNLLINTHLSALQAHLADLCPGQVVDIRTQFVAQANSRDLNSGSDSQNRDDFASFDQGNRGSSNHDDAL